MSELAQLIIDNDLADEANAGDWAAIETALNSATVEKTDSTLRSTLWLTETFDTDLGDPSKPGWTEADLVIASLENSANPPTIRSALDTMKNRENGLDLSKEKIQTALSQLSGLYSWPAGLANRLKEYGRKMVSPATAAELPVVTQPDAQAAWIQQQREDAYEAVLTRHNAGSAAALAALDAGQTAAEITAAATAAEA